MEDAVSCKWFEVKDMESVMKYLRSVQIDADKSPGWRKLCWSRPRGQ